MANLARQWDQIANYESFELVKRDYAARHGITPSLGHAREIAAPFTHARSYFRAAGGAELTVKPLLLYYGVASLSRGLTLMLTGGLREADLDSKHGLSAKKWREEVLGDDNPDFAALRVSVKKSGAFGELCKATGHRSLLRNNDRVARHVYISPPVPVDSEISLGDLLARLPTLEEHHIRWRRLTRCCRLSAPPGAFHGTPPAAPTDIRFHVYLGTLPLTRDMVKEFLAETTLRLLGEIPSNKPVALAFFGTNDPTVFPGLTDAPSPSDDSVGQLWMTALYPGRLRLSKAATLFALSYILGMLVRYHPTQWTALVHGQSADAALPTLSAAVDFIESEFPKVILDFLLHKDGPPWDDRLGPPYWDDDPMEVGRGFRGGRGRGRF